MKTNPHDLVFPAKSDSLGGLSIREHFAALAMQAILNTYPFSDPKNVATLAVQNADALIARLNESEPTK